MASITVSSNRKDSFWYIVKDIGLKMKPLLLSGRDSIFCLRKFSDFVADPSSLLVVVLKCSLISFGFGSILDSGAVSYGWYSKPLWVASMIMHFGRS